LSALRKIGYCSPGIKLRSELVWKGKNSMLKIGFLKLHRRNTLHTAFVTFMGATLALASLSASAQHHYRPPYGRHPGPGRPLPPMRPCRMRGGQRSADLGRIVNADGRGTETLNLRQLLDLGPECSGVRLSEVRVFAHAMRNRHGGRFGAEARLILDGRNTGYSQRIEEGQYEGLVFEFPSNENEIGRETHTIQIEIRGRAYVDQIVLVADRGRGGFEDDGQIEDAYSFRPIPGNPTEPMITERVNLYPSTSTLTPRQGDSILKGLELKAVDDDFQIVSLKINFKDRGSESLNLGRRFIPEGRSLFVDFESSRFRDVRAVRSIEITGKQVEIFDRRPRLKIIGIEPRGGRWDDHDHDGHPGHGHYDRDEGMHPDGHN
jgi:hypothetical protein